MGSPLWGRSPGQPWRVVWSLLGQAASRLVWDRTTRLFEEDEEMLVLTCNDELNRIYTEGERSPIKSVKSRNNPQSDDTKESQSSTGENGQVFTHEDDKTLTDKHKSLRSTVNPRLESPTFEETGAEVLSTSVDVTSVNSCPVKITKGFGKKKQLSEMQGNKRGNNLNQNPEKKSTFCMVHRSSRGRLSGNRNKENKENEMTSTHNLLISLQKEHVTTNLASPVQSLNTDATALDSHPFITAWEASWNVTNAIQGIFVLGLPFALIQSGYMGLMVLVLSAWVCNHTGRRLVACLYEEEHSGKSNSVSKVRVRHSYQDIMDACCKGLWPNWSVVGGWMINVAQVIELLMTCTLYLLVSTTLLCDSLSAVAPPRSVCSLMSLMFLLPCLLLTDLRPVSMLSLLCSLAHVLISLLVILYCLSCASNWSWSFLSLSVDPEDFIVSVGVIIFSYTSQIFLPPLEGSMEDRGQFDTMLGWTHGVACIMKTTFSLLAVLTWGPDTSEVITDNLPPNLRPVVNLCLLAKALLSYPLPFYSAAEILQTCLLRDASLSSSSKQRSQGVSCPTLMVRGALLLSSYLLSLLVPRFSLLMGLTGSVTGAAMTLILPCLFHLKLRWGRLTVLDRLIDMSILSLGVLCSVAGVICSVKRMLEDL
ncbi:vesicular inhibitory amino acid transporter-like [Poeciliopsis prolifica]|uniref:vesicular inhibitory amino acid transporter-like n=1 Tax=Poeciliopsis prolifica TaxID=188132 RepID=UPI0024137B73|nr:vesicular inhibitory amino acid transporter-like [Poeciliopsis prolifica]